MLINRQIEKQKQISIVFDDKNKINFFLFLTICFNKNKITTLLKRKHLNYANINDKMIDDDDI